MERANQTVLALLQAELLKHSDSSWVKHISSVDLGINSSMAHASGKTPFEVVYGTLIQLPIDLALG